MTTPTNPPPTAPASAEPSHVEAFVRWARSNGLDVEFSADAGRVFADYLTELCYLATQEVPYSGVRAALPEPVQRLRDYAGKTRQTVRNPNITAREAITIGNWIASTEAENARLLHSENDSLGWNQVSNEREPNKPRFS